MTTVWKSVEVPIRIFVTEQGSDANSGLGSEPQRALFTIADAITKASLFDKAVQIIVLPG